MTTQTHFTASNGVHISVDGDGDYVFLGGEAMHYVTRGGKNEQAFREMVQAEADERLGRWRWPENPEYVVYAPVDFTHYVRVLNERDAMLEVIHQERLDERGSLMAQAARAYFDAHREPKPWHEANAGEVWLLTVDREVDVPAVASSSEGGHIVFTAATGGAAVTEEIGPLMRYITAGRRIWPEVSE